MNETNRSNYVVDLGSINTNRRTRLHQILKDLAMEYNWTMLGWGSCKRYFRFGYVDNVVDPEYVGDAGFYYWTADSMRSDNYKVVTFSKAIELLTTMDMKIPVKEIRIGAHKVLKYNGDSITIGCQRVFNEDVVKLASIVQYYGLQAVEVTDKQGNKVYMTSKQVFELLELTKKGK